MVCFSVSVLLYAYVCRPAGRADKERENPYKAHYDNKTFRFGSYYSYEDFVIALRSQFVQNEDAKALLAEWWTVMLHKYELPSLAVKLDEVNKYFYTCNDDNDVPSLNGEYVPKKTNAAKCWCNENSDTPCSCYVL